MWEGFQFNDSFKKLYIMVLTLPNTLHTVTVSEMCTHWQTTQDLKGQIYNLPVSFKIIRKILTLSFSRTENQQHLDKTILGICYNIYTTIKNNLYVYVPSALVTFFAPVVSMKTFIKFLCSLLNFLHDLASNWLCL